ncbi:GTPase [Botrimarina mediterranea]|uniref:GTPase n=1 Tax=Botrimarina mediterranea TaxID=2528022 RepID=UPI001187DE6E|nr:tRNA modification GTPase MnmE [Planctomycetes bacterium K2D]
MNNDPPRQFEPRPPGSGVQSGAAAQVRVLTPAGRGAIAVVEVVGDNAATLVDHWFEGSQPLAEAPIDAIRFGRWRRAEDDAPGEELVVVRTADNRVEVHCHGGVAASAAIMASIESSALAAGDACRTAPHPRLAPTAHLGSELRLALSNAPTERVAGVLLDQLGGALEAALHSVVQLVREGETERAIELIDDLLSRERLGVHLTRPWRVVIAGAPNVGKSSLINALVGYDRAIVFDQPGTTRDVVTAATAIGGWPATLADTAGVRATNDALEAAGVELALATLRSADIVVVAREAATFDSAESITLHDSLLREVSPDAAIVEVATKADLAPAGETIPPTVVATDAPHGVGVPELLAAIERAMGVAEPDHGVAVVIGPWRYDVLRQVRAALANLDVAAAQQAAPALLAPAKP